MNEQIFEKKFDKIESRLDGIEDMQEKTYNLLVGNPIHKNDTGLAGRFEKLESKVEKIESWRTRVIYIAVGMSFGAGWGISDIITKLFNH